MREIRTSGLMSGIWKRKKRSDIQTPTNRKGRKQLRLNLIPPRQISTLLAPRDEQGNPLVEDSLGGPSSPQQKLPVSWFVGNFQGLALPPAAIPVTDGRADDSVQRLCPMFER